jgi:RNA polymerase sigma-70 factor, ECF subfamily
LEQSRPITWVRVSAPETIEAARAGDPAALEALYRELAPAVLGFFRAHGMKEPEDLTSETFVGMVRGLPRFTGDERALRSWVFSIAHRRLIDERRRLARKREELLDPARIPESPGGDVEEEAAARLGERWALDAVSQLTPDQRDVILLRVLADLSVHEVATMLGRSAGSVKSLQRRAVGALFRRRTPVGQIDRGVS